MLCVLMTWVMMKKYSCSIRGMVEECEARPGLCRKLGMDHVPSKSWLHKWMKRIPLDLLDSLLRFTAGGDARRTLSVDSTQYTFNRYVLVEDAKRGKFYRKTTVKHHALITDSGRIVAVVVTDGNAGDSPVLAELCARAPRGEGYLLGDSALLFQGELPAGRVHRKAAVLPAQEELRGPRHERVGQDAGLVQGPPRRVLQDVWQTKHDRELLLGGQGPVQFQDSVSDAGDATTRDRHHVHLPESLCLIGDKKSPVSPGTRGGDCARTPDPADNGVFAAGDATACHRRMG